MYGDGICVINVFIYSLIHSPIFTSFAQQIRRPLCVHHDLLLAARICLHLSQRLACIMERSVVVIWFLWGQKWIVAFRRGTFLFVLIIILKVLWLTSNRCWADVGGRHQPNVETTLGRHRTADIDPTSAQHMFPCIFFSLHNLPELLCAEIVPMLEAAINSGLVFGMVTDLLYTNMKTWFILTHWGPDKMIAIFQTTFSNALSWMQIYEFRLNFTEVCLQGSNWQYIPALVQINGLAPASNKPLSFCTLCLDQSVTSSKQNSHIFRHVNITLTSITLVSQITGYSTRLFVQPVTNGFPSQKASNAASVRPMLVQRWHTTIGITLCQRWPNVSVPTLDRCWHNVGPTLACNRWANVGPIDKSTLAQRWWADVGPT